MAAVILGILKIVGIVLLVILCVIAALILLLLLWPFCYTFTFTKHGNDIRAGAHISWLIRGLYAKGSLRYNGELKTDGDVRLFGIPILKILRNRKNRPSGTGKKPESSKQNHSSSKKMNRPQGRLADGSAKKKPTVRPGEHKAGTSSSAGRSSVTITTEIVKLRKPGFFEKLGARISAFFGKIKKFIRKMKNDSAKLSELLEYLGSDSFANAKNGLTGALKVILRSILPRKISGSVDYAMDDPALTGQILAVIAIFYPVLPEGLSIHADFENFDEKRLEADIRGSGHFLLIVILIQVIRLLLNKDFRTLIGRLKKAGKNRKRRKGE